MDDPGTVQPRLVASGAARHAARSTANVPIVAAPTGSPFLEDALASDRIRDGRSRGVGPLVRSCPSDTMMVSEGSESVLRSLVDPSGEAAMAVTLPYRSERSVIRPKATCDYPNGLIAAEHLARCGIRSLVMVEPAAVAMQAMVDAAAEDGLTLSATGTWRSYDQQVALFLQRYTTRCHPGRRHERWKGLDYWLRPGVAGAAVPGTSNHGRGLAVDLSEGARGTTPLRTKTLRWLAKNGPRFGYWNTVRSEPWHWCYCLGDEIPEAVFESGAGAVAQPVPAMDWEAIALTDERLRALMYPGLLRRGDRSEAVMAVQWVLVASGHQLVADGDFGPDTHRAVCAFQRSNGLDVDGLVGPETWGALGLRGGVGGPVPDSPSEPAQPEPAQPEPAQPEPAQPASALAEPELPGQPSAQVATYVVQPSDGFVRIAKRTLWSSSTADAERIARANGLDLDSPIHPGQRLQIPGCRSTRVAPGDGWIAIARRLGRDVAAVRAANEWQGDTLHPGMVVYGGRIESAPPNATEEPAIPVTAPTLRTGDDGADVERWQAMLVAAGFDPGGVDGRFGIGTAREHASSSGRTA